jgi:hypothetical protein
MLFILLFAVDSELTYIAAATWLLTPVSTMTAVWQLLEFIGIIVGMICFVKM